MHLIGLIIISNFFALIYADENTCPIKKWYELNDDEKFPIDKCLIEDKKYEERKSLFLHVCRLSSNDYELITKSTLGKIDNNKFLFFYFTNLELFLPWDLFTCFSRKNKFILKNNINNKLESILGNNVFIMTFIKTINSLTSCIVYLGIIVVAFTESLVSGLIKKIFVRQTKR